MEAPANNCKDPQRELPERYTPLVEYVSRKLGGLNVAFNSAFRRIESHRLLAEHKLRKTLQTYWSMNREDLNDLRPFDILHSFGGYAEATFKAAGEECVGMFSDAEAYRSFLFVAQEWVLENIVPKPQTLKQSTANLLKAVEGMRALAEQVQEFGGPQDRDMVPQLDAAIREIKESSVEIPDDPKFERVAELVLRTRIIGLRETFSAFEEGCPESAGDLLSWGGDWEQVLDDSFVDALRMGSDLLGASVVASAFKLALRRAGNRDEAKEFWAVGLEQLHATLLAAWWSMSADARARDANTDRLDAEAENDRRGPTSGASTGRPAPKVARRSLRYRVIDEVLQKIAESRPRTQEEVFQSLDGRKVVIPPAEPFETARGWIAGFRRDPAAARAWLSKRWTGLNLSRLPRGPKNSKK
jgi:hypothetical protein